MYLFITSCECLKAINIERLFHCKIERKREQNVMNEVIFVAYIRTHTKFNDKLKMLIENV